MTGFGQRHDDPEFWQVTYQGRDGEFVGAPANSESDAALKAAGASRIYGRTTITTREGVVAVYVDGELQGGVL